MSRIARMTTLETIVGEMRVERSGTASSSFASSRVSQFPARFPSADVRDIGQAGRLLRSDHVVPPGLPHQLAHGREVDVKVEGDKNSMPARHSINKDRERGRLAQKAKRSSRVLA
jgi:hypothetical protein